MTCAQVLYDSAFFRYRSVLTYDGTVVSGFEAANMCDWRDFTVFRVGAAGTVHLKIQLGAATTFDCAQVWCPVSGANGATVTFDTSPDNSTWTVRATFTPDASGTILWTDFTPVTMGMNEWVRFTIVATGISDFRQLSAGPKLMFPIGQWAEVAPPSLLSGVVMNNVIAVNGSIRRLEKKGDFQLTHLDQTWVRTYWDVFAQSAARRAFWWRWNPTDYPNEIAFAAAEDIVAPTNDKPPPLMKATMPIRFLT
jgi:hypothetical protein